MSLKLDLLDPAIVTLKNEADVDAAIEFLTTVDAEAVAVPVVQKRTYQVASITERLIALRNVR